MPFREGDKKPDNSGRKPGTPNVITKAVRDRLAEFIDATTGRMIQIANDSDDKIFTELYLDILEYIIPKLSRSEIKAEVNEMTAKRDTFLDEMEQEPDIPKEPV